MIINAIKDGVGITGGGTKPPVLEQLNATENGTYTPSDGVDGFNPVNVDVQPNLQTKSININENGAQTIEADSDFYGLDSVNLNIDVQPNLQTKAVTITENGTSSIVPDSGFYGLESVGVEVNVQPNLQAKSTTTTITSNGTSTITLEPDSNYDGLSSASVDVNVNVPIPEFTTEELVATANGTYTPSTNGYSKVRVNVSEPVSKYVVPNGMKFGHTRVFNPDDFDFSNVTDMSNMFYNCFLTSLDLSGLDTSSVTSMSRMFYGCSKLTSIDFSGWDTSKVTNMSNMSNMFYGCTSLTNFNMNSAILPKMDLTNWHISTCTKLTVDSLVSVLNALQQLDEGTSYTCTIGSDNLAKLTDEQKAIATNKGWTLN